MHLPQPLVISLTFLILHNKNGKQFFRLEGKIVHKGNQAHPIWKHNPILQYTRIQLRYILNLLQLIQFQLMLRKMGNPVVQHNFREENIVADCLAKLGVNLNLPGTVISLRSPPLAVATHLADDVEGIVSTRNLLYVENPSVSSYVNSDAKPTSINVSGCTSATVRAFDESTPLLCTA
ncbi:uncharacterized protein LOC107848169 isoform X2 [Capsicum annuum]|uniref:uncharacterized protein LOC107848169 isoform X2 n=1 Tax=Capsicum annuum TaxID=4072 RepID=UPI001FB15834|nr:uncharacterized protein LOC107848169 isoform X2 [Capsicum annuum]